MKRLLCNIVFLFLIFFTVPAYALTSGTTATGSIPAGGSSSQSFTGDAGQGVMLYANAGYTVVMEIKKPDGTVLGTYATRTSITLPATGTYSIKLTAYFPTDSGTYTLAYLRGSDSVSDGSLTSGKSYNGSITTNGIASFQFTGTAGQGVLLNSYAAYGTQISVFNPDGSPWSSVSGRFSGTLGYTGTYTVAVVGAFNTDSGNYRLDYVRGSAGVSNGTIGSGTSSRGTLATNGLESFQFKGVAGQGILFNNQAAYNASIAVFNPDGSPWSTQSVRFAGTLGYTGTYTAVLIGNFGTDSGSYRLDYLKGKDNVSEGWLVTGKTRSDSLQLNGIESYKFTGVSGNSLSITATAGYTTPMNLYYPDGSFWTTTYGAFPLTLSSTGTYSLALMGAWTTDTGPYTLSQGTAAATVAASTGSMVPTVPPTCNPTANQVGNPINYDVGFKSQFETDYDVGGLNFSRIYRSDSTWTNNTIGTLWRTNYARTLSVSSSSASITDGTGATTQFTSAGGLWMPVNPATTATFFTSGSNYLYTLADNTVEKYSSASKLTRISYQDGGGINLSYNSSGLLSTIANENLRQMTLTYGSTSKVSTLVTPDGNYSYLYDANGNLTKVTKPNTKFRTYHYENGTYVNALTGITDESGVRFASFTYDASGKGTLTQHAGPSDGYTIAYGSAATSTVTNPLAKNTTYNFINFQSARQSVQVDGAASTNCVAANRYRNFDDNGWLIGATDWENNTTRYQYDARGNITKLTEATGTAQERTTTLTFASSYNLPLTVSEPGRTTTSSYDPYGRVTSVTVTDTATAQSRTTTYTYYSNTTDGSGNLVLGRLNTVDGPRTDVSDVTTYFYDANLNLTKIRNALSQDTQITTRDAAGRPTNIQDPSGVNTALIYNSSGLLGSLVYSSGTALAATTSYVYDANNNLKQVTQPNSVVTKYTYDSAQRLTGITDGLNNTITYTLNAAGNVTLEQYKTSGAVLKYTHTRAYDELARLIQSVGASSQIAFTSYDKNSNINRYKDANTNVTSYAYDPLIQFISSTNALSGVTQLQYTSLSDPNRVQDPRSNATTYTYNAFGDVTSETSPDRGTLTFSSIDGAGNIRTMTDARGQIVNYTYDALNRLTAIAYTSATAQNATLTYDSASGIGCGTGIGHLCFTSDTGRTAYQYNTLGQLTYVSESRGAVNFTTTYAWDKAGFLTGLTLPSGRTISYTSNANGQIASVVGKVNGSNVTLASSIVYLPFGPLNTMTYGNTRTFTGSYNTDYNPTSMAVSSIYTNTYTTDNVGNITKAGTPTYGYDSLLRLSSESGTTQYTYDATSNRATKVMGGTTTTTIPSSSNKISAVGANSLTYDSSGNILTYVSSAYNWNAANQLAFVSTSGSTVGTYTYNSLNQRTQKLVSGATTNYVYGLNGQLYGEYTSAGALVREYIYLNGQPLAQVNAGSPEFVTYLHPDHLGTPRYGTNSAGTQVWNWTSDAFGNGTPTGSVTVNLRMPGQYYDSESGLFYNWNRYYSPALGRYITSDPIGLAGGLNTFNYVDQSPVMYFDPLGVDWVYFQDSGTLAHYPETFSTAPNGPFTAAKGSTPDYVANGYAGTNDTKMQCTCGLNNPDMQDVPFIGPVTQGLWTIGRPYNHPTLGPMTMNIVPAQDTNTFGRDAFRIHGDNKAKNHTASEGCIVMPLSVRKAIANSQDNRLIVVKGNR
jgi:RHS repeat-associated protein